MWFSETNTGNLGFIDLAGGTFAVTEFPTPTPATPLGMSLGPNRNDLWFAEYEDRIGQVVFPPTPGPRLAHGVRTTLFDRPVSIYLPTVLAGDGLTPYGSDRAPVSSVWSLAHDDVLRRIGGRSASDTGGAELFAGRDNLFAITGPEGLLPAFTQSPEGMVDWLW